MNSDMGQFFSDNVEEGIRLVWYTFIPGEMQRGMQLLEAAAGEGDADAMCFLARCYMGGEYVWAGGGLPENDELSVKWIKESVLKGSAAGVLCAMRCGELTPAIRRSMPYTTTRARDIILEKAQAGHAFCQYMIGNAYYWGDIIEIDRLDLETDYSTEEAYNTFAYPIAVEWYERALENGLTIVIRNLQTIYENGEGGLPEDKEKVFYYTKLASRQGDPEMMNNYGALLSEAGHEKEGFRWYKQSADAGEPVGCYNVGWGYEYGKGVTENQRKAFGYYMKAAQKEYPDAYFKLGSFYYDGDEAEEDNAKAVYWLQKGADEEDYWCYPKLATCYQNGWGAEQNYGEAFELLTLAEEYLDDYDDDTRSIVLDGLGNAYGYGEGTDEDFRRAIEYYQAAAELGNENSMESLKHFKTNLIGKWKRTDD